MLEALTALVNFLTLMESGETWPSNLQPQDWTEAQKDIMFEGIPIPRMSESSNLM